MKKNILKMSVLSIFFLPFTVFSQVGIGTTTPNFQLDINVGDKVSDGINIQNTSFSSQLLLEPLGSTFAFNNSDVLGNFNIRFNNNTRYIFNSNDFEPSIDAADNTVSGAVDIGVFDKHFRRVYTRGIHSNDMTVNGGLRINIGGGGGIISDYNFSDFAFYPETSQNNDLGRNGNFWRDIFFVNAFVPSDRRLKENISDNDRGLSTVMRLNTYQYNYIKDTEKKKHFGFMAQEVLEILPEIIDLSDNADAALAVNYLETIPILVKAIQEQNETISGQLEKIEMMEKEIQLIKELLSKH